jgi:hypothetical protein
MPPSKLSEADKQIILDLYQNSEETTSSLASRYGVSNTTIIRLLKGHFTEADYEALIQKKRSGRFPGSDLTGSAQTADPETSNPETPVPAKRQPARKRSSRLALEDRVNQVIEQLPLLDLPVDLPVSPPDSSPIVTQGAAPITDKPAPPTLRQPVKPKPQPVDQSPSLRSASQLPPEFAADIAELQADLASAPADIQDIDEDGLDDDDQDDLDDDLQDFEDDDLDDLPLQPGELSIQVQSGRAIEILPIAAATLPRTCYLVVDRIAELVTRPLKDFNELGQIPADEIEHRILPVFDNHRLARRFSNRNQRIIKVPDSNLLCKAATYLQAKGITRLLIDGQVYALG